MSHARHARRIVTLRFTEQGGAELLAGGRTLWASDADPDFVEDFGDNLIGDYESAATDDDADDLLVDVLDYLVAAGLLTDEEANDARLEGLGEDADEPDLEADEDADQDQDDDEEE